MRIWSVVKNSYRKEENDMVILDRTVAPEMRQIENFSIGVPACHVMHNGIPLHIIQAGDEDVVRFDLLIKGGQWEQTAPLQAMFTNRMLREGTRTLSSARIAERLDYYGAWLDLSSSVNYGFVTLYSLNKYFPQTLEILASMVKEPAFPEKELSVIAESNKQQFLVNAERVEVITRKQLNRSLFGLSHPLGKYAQAKDYDCIHSGMLRDFYRKYYRSNNSSAYVSGKVTSEIIRCIERFFGDEAWGDMKESSQHIAYMPEPDGRKRVFIERPGAMQSSLKIGGFTINRLHPDYHKLRVLVTLLGGYFGSRLMSNIREEKGYTYGIGANLVCYPDKGMLIISTEAANEYINQIIKEVYKEIDILSSEKVPDEELNMVKNYMLGDMCRSYEGAFSLSDAWIFIETAGLKDCFFEESLDAIRSVTASDLQALAQKYLRKEHLIEIIAGKKMRGEAS